MAEPAVDALQSDDPIGDNQRANRSSLAGLSEILNPLVGLLSIGANMFNTYKTNQTNAANVAATNKANADLWREQSLYNSPVEQMKRLKMAGLNPSMLYGQGGLENLAGTPPDMKSSQAQSYMIDPLTAAQVANLDAQTESIKHQTQRDDDKHPLTLEGIHRANDLMEQQRKDLIARLNLDKRKFELDKYVASVEAEYKSSTSDSLAREANVSEGNLMLALALYPFMNEKNRNEANYYFQKARDAKNDADIKDADVQFSKFLQSLYSDFAEYIKTDEIQKIMTSIAQNAAAEQHSIWERNFAENNPLGYTFYRLLGGSSTGGAVKTGIRILAGKMQ